MSPITKSDISSFRFSIRTTKPSVISVLIFNPIVIHRGYILHQSLRKVNSFFNSNGWKMVGLVSIRPDNLSFMRRLL